MIPDFLLHSCLMALLRLPFLQSESWPEPFKITPVLSVGISWHLTIRGLRWTYETTVNAPWCISIVQLFISYCCISLCTLVSRNISCCISLIVSPVTSPGIAWKHVVFFLRVLKRSISVMSHDLVKQMNFKSVILALTEIKTLEAA